MSMAKVQIIGNVGRDPEQRYAASGAMVVSFSVAVNTRRRGPDGAPIEETEWYRVSTFGRLAEVAQQYVTKGQQIYIDGRLRLDRWTGQDGQPRTTLDVVASEMQLLGSRQRGEGADGGEPDAGSPAGGARGAPRSEPSDLEDLPF